MRCYEIYRPLFSNPKYLRQAVQYFVARFCGITISGDFGPFDAVVAFLKFMFSKKATQINEIFTVLIERQIDGEDFVNFCGLLRKCEL